MQSTLEENIVHPKLERIANILGFVGWSSLWVQAGFGAASILMLLFAITGRSFNQAVTSTPGIPVAGYSQGTTPGSGVILFWAVCGVLVLLFSIFMAFRITRYAKRLRNPNSALHPKKAEVMQLLKIAAIAGFVGMLLTIIGSGSSLGVLLAKSITQPQGVAVYDPTRIIRPIDIFAAIANMSGIIAHFIGTAAAGGLFIWLHPELYK
jgi:Protein of unknown function (DUF3611)